MLIGKVTFPSGSVFSRRSKRPGQDSDGPSWLTFLGHMKDSLWSMDLFRCESVWLRTNWVLVVMDQYTRRIIGFGVHVGTVDGVSLCRMFNRAIRGQRAPKDIYLYPLCRNVQQKLRQYSNITTLVGAQPIRR